MSTTPSPLGLNHGGYYGETIDIQAVLKDILEHAQKQSWHIEHFSNAPSLLSLTRTKSTHQRNIYLSAGIHGDEPAGPLALRTLFETNAWPEDCNLWICPCLNPLGFQANSRENPQGIDLNREYHAPSAPEAISHVKWLRQQPRFDLALCLHEDWEAKGFYLYELNPGNHPSLAPSILQSVSSICPIDPSETIEGRRAQYGWIRAEEDPTKRPQWPEAFYLISHHTTLSYTLEAPSDFPLPIRVQALAQAVVAALVA